MTALEPLIEASAAGDWAAFAALYDAAAPQLFGLAMRILKRRDWAEDVLQEALISAWRNAGDYRRDLGSGKTWLVARREYKEHVGKKSFWISLILPPLLFSIIIGIQILSFKARPEETKKIILVDNSGKLGNEIAADLAEDTFKSGKKKFVDAGATVEVK